MNGTVLPEDEAAIESSFETLQPIDVTTAEKVLKEIKQILDELGGTFFLSSGVCLGAIRDNGLIPWDDDLDVGSVIGLHGLTEKSIDRVVTAFRDNDFITAVMRQDQQISVPLLKSSIRTDLQCNRIIDGSIFNYPGIRTPIRLFTHLKEIDFLGEKFYVPNPPEEYLRLKYGEDWRTPKKIGCYEKDILAQVPEGSSPGRAGKLKQFTIKHLLPWRATQIRVLDSEGTPVAGAEVVVAGLGRSSTNRQGYAKLYIPSDFIYALVVRFANHEEVLYEERLSPGETYLYRADAQVTSGRNFTLTLESQL